MCAMTCLFLFQRWTLARRFTQQNARRLTTWYTDDRPELKPSDDSIYGDIQ